MSKKYVSFENVGQWCANARVAGKRLVVTNGCFDLLHVGHVKTLELAKSFGDLLLVGINSDSAVSQLKGKDRPIVSMDERATLVAALECVDAVTIFDDLNATRLLEITCPDVWCKGGDYAPGSLDQNEVEVVRRQGGTICLLPLLAGQSTSRLIDVIKRRR